MIPIIYSHGFGVEKSARGMFSDISKSLPDRSHMLFDYNTKTEDGLEVAPFELQAKLLQKHIDDAIRDGYGSVDIICHSQGSVAATLLEDSGHIRKAIFIAPPRNLDTSGMNAMFGKRPGIIRYPDGRLHKIPRRDGSMTTIPTSYWENREGIDLPRLYEEFASKVPTYVILAQNDEVLGSDDLEDIAKGIRSQIVIPGNHDFTELADRIDMIGRIKDILES